MYIYGLSNCDSCRKARKALTGANFVDIRKEPVPQPILEAAFREFEDRLVNKRSTTWRNLSEEERAKPPLELLRDNPPLMKRPLIVQETQMVLGFDKAAKDSLGL